MFIKFVFKQTQHSCICNSAPPCRVCYNSSSPWFYTTQTKTNKQYFNTSSVFFFIFCFSTVGHKRSTLWILRTF